MSDAKRQLPTQPADETLFHPWFLPKSVHQAMRSMIPPSYYAKMRNMFDDYGCMVCGRDAEYASNGMCRDCANRVRGRLLRSARRRMVKPCYRFDAALLRRQRLAKKLLGRFAASRKAPRVRHIDRMHPFNPVDEALSALPIAGRH